MVLTTPNDSSQGASVLAESQVEPPTEVPAIATCSFVTRAVLVLLAFLAMTRAFSATTGSAVPSSEGSANATVEPVTWRPRSPTRKPRVRSCTPSSSLDSCIQRYVAKAPFPCTSHTSMLLLASRRPPQAQTIRNAIRAASRAGMCAYVLVVGLDMGCAASVDKLVEEEGADPSERPAYAEGNGMDSSAHVDVQVDGCAIDGPRPAVFPLVYFGWTVKRYCAGDGVQLDTIVSTLTRLLDVPSHMAHIVDVTKPATFRFDGTKFASSLCTERSFCAVGWTFEACRAKRSHVHRLRMQLQHRDVFGVAVPFAARLGAPAEQQFLFDGTVNGSAPLDVVPTSCARVRATLETEAYEAEASDPPHKPILSVALAMSGAIRTLQATVPRNMKIFSRSLDANWYYFANVATSFPVQAATDVRGIRALFSQPNLLAAALLDRAVYPTMTDVARDHFLDGYRTSRPVRSIPDTLMQYLNVYLAGRLRQMYETRCDLRFDITIRMRTDTYMNVAVPSEWLQFDMETLWVDRGRDFGGLNDQWWAGPSRLVDQLMDTYFKIPHLVSSVGFHGETLVRATANESVGDVVRRPKFEISRIHRDLMDFTETGKARAGRGT